MFVPVTDRERAAMLARIGVSSADELFAQVPERLRFPALDLPAPLTELELQEEMAALAGANRPVGELVSFRGAGAYYHYIPSAAGHVAGMAEFLTAYTPYQPEVSQGTLQSIFEFQSLVCELLGMEVANASVYDGPTALAEAVLMAMRLTRRSKVLVSGSVHPHYREVVRTYLRGQELDIATGGVLRDAGRAVARDLAPSIDEQTACCVVQQPDFFGRVSGLSALAEMAHGRGALLIVVVADPVTLGVLKSPGEWGADIAVADGQAFGVPLSFGGPYVGLMATRMGFVRQLAGRIVGQTVDVKGRRGFVLTLQAREQHIRREKATSNLCTNQALVALTATAYLGIMGPQGLKRAAELSFGKAHYAADRLSSRPGYAVLTPEPFFHEFVLSCPRPPEVINQALLEQGVLGGMELGRYYPDLHDCMLLCFTEMNTRGQIDSLVDALAQIGGTA